MYGKCKALLEAENVFCRLGQRTALSWNMLMSSYVEQGLGEETLLCYRQMQHEGVEPDKHTFIFAFQACEICMSAENDFSLQEQDPCQVILEIGETLHAAAYMKNFLSDVLVSTALLRMYGSCGAISEANSVFCALSEHDIIAWNALLSIYQEWGQAVECLQLYGYMWKQGYIPDQLTHMISFQACSILVEQDEILVEEGHFQNSKALEIGRALHIDAERQGHVSGGFVSNAILSMYMKCGEIFETETTFCSFSQRDTVSWSVMILLYLEQKQFEKCFWLYRQMQHEGIRVDHCVLMSVARACGELADSKQVTGFKQSSLEMACLEIGEALHADVLKGDFAANTFLNTTLLSMYSKCGAINKVEHMVGLISQRDTVSWNALLSAYVEHGQGDKVLQGYMQMLRDNLCPDELTFICSLQACGILAENENTFQGHETPVRIICLEIGRALHMDASKLGLISNTKTMTALLTMYGKCGFVAKAENVFLTLPHFDIVSWNAMLSVLIGQNEMENALQLYQVMQRKGMVNDVTLTCILSACTDAGNLDLCQQIHFYAVAARYELINSVTSALIHAYGDCGDFVDAQAVFEGFSKPDSVSWSACLTGCAGKGDSSTCIGVFEELKLEGIKQDEVMFTSVMSACNRAGSVGECLEFFFLLKDSGLVPSLKHYGIVVELLGRAGDFGRLENFLEKMEVKADLTLWMCVLGSCHTHQNVELAKWAFDCVEKLQSRTSMPYVLMSNILVCATECG
ncbi:hypothetical protein KP509_1Z015700 [Ceratopteris richardii]|nr:hypothetical protein KP509_1Z015700 [Ceratopteris richardii]